MKKKLIKTLWTIIGASALAIGVITPLCITNTSTLKKSTSVSTPTDTSSTFKSLKASPTTLDQISGQSELTAEIPGYNDDGSESLTWECESSALSFITLANTVTSGADGLTNTLTYNNSVAVTTTVYIKCTYNGGIYRRVGITLIPIQPTISVDVDGSLNYNGTNTVVITVTAIDGADLSKIDNLIQSGLSFSPWTTSDSYATIKTTVSLDPATTPALPPGTYPITIASNNNSFPDQVVNVVVQLRTISAAVSGYFPEGQSAVGGLITITGVNTTADQLENLLIDGGLSFPCTINGLTIQRDATPATSTTIAYEVVGIATYSTPVDLNFVNKIAGLNCTATFNCGWTMPFESIKQYFTYNSTGDRIEGFATNGDYNLLKLCTQLGCTSIQLGNNIVRQIWNNAFLGCASFSTNSCLKSIDATSITNRIGDYAFQGCASLSFIKIGLVGQLGSYAFTNCVNLTIPTSGVQFNNIATASFSGCEHLTYDMVNNITINMTTASKIYNGQLGVAWVNTPDGTKGNAIVGSLAAGDLGTYTTYIANASTIINYAFRGCASVTKIDLGNNDPLNPISIGAGAFQFCVNTVFSGNPEIISIGDSAFNGCAKLSYEFVDGISLDATLFEREKNGTVGIAWRPKTKTDQIHSAGSLAYGDLGNYSKYVTVDNIGSRAFYNCMSITRITLDNSSPGTPININELAFGDCRQTVFTSSATTSNPLAIKLVPPTSTNNDNSAFLGCAKLTSSFIDALQLSGNLNFIRVYANGSSADDGVAWVPANTGGTRNSSRISDAGCLAWGDLGNYSLYVTSVGTGAFKGCASVKSINLGNSPINFTGNSAFRDDDNITIQFI